MNLEGELLITRDSLPVAKLVRVSPESARRRRWDMEAHARWQARVSGGKVSATTLSLAQNREERTLISGGS